MNSDLAIKLNRRFPRMESVESSSDTSSINGTGTNDDLDLLISPSPTNYQCQRSFSFNPYIEYNELSRKQIKCLMNTFNEYDTDKDKLLNFDELKYMMEKLGVPQTHLSLKNMIMEVSEDQNGKISFREFLLIFRKAILENRLAEDDKTTILNQFYSMIFEIDVAKEGVGGAKKFFEAKIAAMKDSEKFHREIREEQDERRRFEEEKIRRKLAFQTRLAQFQPT